MRIIAVSKLKKYWDGAPGSEQALKAWVQEVQKHDWHHSGELKMTYRNASIISAKRVVFNIKGNSYRLIVDVEYRLKIVFIVWIGTHEDYDSLDVKKVKYDTTNKK